MACSHVHAVLLSNALSEDGDVLPALTAPQVSATHGGSQGQHSRSPLAGPVVAAARLEGRRTVCNLPEGREPCSTRRASSSAGTGTTRCGRRAGSHRDSPHSSPPAARRRAAALNTWPIARAAGRTARGPWHSARIDKQAGALAHRLWLAERQVVVLIRQRRLCRRKLVHLQVNLSAAKREPGTWRGSAAAGEREQRGQARAAEKYGGVGTRHSCAPPRHPGTRAVRLRGGRRPGQRAPPLPEAPLPQTREPGQPFLAAPSSTAQPASAHHDHQCLAV